MTSRGPILGTRPIVITTILLTSASLLTGCVSDIDRLVEPKTTGATVMTPDDARHDLWDRLDAAQTIFGGTWDEHDSPIATSFDDTNGFHNIGEHR